VSEITVRALYRKFGENKWRDKSSSLH